MKWTVVITVLIFLLVAYSGCDNTGKGKMVEYIRTTPSLNIVDYETTGQHPDIPSLFAVAKANHTVDIKFYSVTDDLIKTSGIKVKATPYDIQKGSDPCAPNRWLAGGIITDGISKKNGIAKVDATQTLWTGEQDTVVIFKLHNPAKPALSKYWWAAFYDHTGGAWTDLGWTMTNSHNGMSQVTSTTPSSSMIMEWPEVTDELPPFEVNVIIIPTDPNDPNIIPNIGIPEFHWGLINSDTGIWEEGEPLLYPLYWKDYETHEPNIMAEPEDANDLLLPEPLVCRINIEILDPSLMPPVGAHSTLLLESIPANSDTALISIPIDTTVTEINGNTITVETQPMVVILWGPDTRWLWTYGYIEDRAYISILSGGRYRISIPNLDFSWYINAWLKEIGSDGYELACDKNTDGIINYLDF